jgi:hypothetical protein
VHCASQTHRNSGIRFMHHTFAVDVLACPRCGGAEMRGAFLSPLWATRFCGRPAPRAIAL